MIMLKSYTTKSVNQDGQKCFCGLQYRCMERRFSIENLYNFIKSSIWIRPASVSPENEGLREQQAYWLFTLLNTSHLYHLPDVHEFEPWTCRNINLAWAQQQILVEPEHNKNNKTTYSQWRLVQISLPNHQLALCGYIAKEPSLLHAGSEDWSLSDWMDFQADLSFCSTCACIHVIPSWSSGSSLKWVIKIS